MRQSYFGDGYGAFEAGMRLAVITNSFIVPRLRLFERLTQERGHEVVVFRYTDWWWTGSEVVQVREWRSVSFRVPFLRDDMYFHFDQRVLKAVLHERFDVIIAYGYGSLTTWIVAVLAKLRGIPFVLFTDARLEYELKRHRIVRLAKRILHALTNRFIASGSSAAIFLAQMGVPAHRITVVPYAIDNQTLYREFQKWRQLRTETRNELGIGKDVVVALYVGRLDKAKGIMELMAAFGCVSSRNQNRYALVLVGDGEARETIEKIVLALDQRSVHIVGQVPHELIAKYYAIADLFVLPSYRDVWGMVINEAMVCGLPIITTSEVGAATDLVREGENGFVIPVDVDALATKLTTLLQDADLRRRMGERSRELIEPWSLDAAIESVETLLGELRAP
jgi:glycosyltransferase involved in cell wall biosynthesis